MSVIVQAKKTGTPNISMKKIFICGLTAALFLGSCASQQDKALKSTDKDFILKTADAAFAKKKWSDALALYEHASSLVAGTEDAANVLYNTAYANYYDKNYPLAGHQFKNFTVTFPQDPRREEAAYMSALTYYQGSMDYNLDQTSTISAIEELQNFLNAYPNSEKAKNIDQLIQELSYKLELKAFENARQYYKTADYKAADIAFDNFLQDFPATRHKKEVLNFQMNAKTELALNSVYDLKEERLTRAVAFANVLERDYPDTEVATNAVRRREALLAEKDRFAKLKVENERQKAEFEARQARLNAQKADKKITETRAALKDSARVATPAPAVVLPIDKKN